MLPSVQTLRVAVPGWARLLIAVVGLAIVWLGILPWYSRQPAMEAHLQWLDDRGIDPSAMYYTELEAMQPILQRLERPAASTAGASTAVTE